MNTNLNTGDPNVGSGNSGVEGAGKCPNCNGTGRLIRVVPTILGKMKTPVFCVKCNGKGIITSKNY